MEEQPETENKLDYLYFQRKVNSLLGMPIYVKSLTRCGPKFGEYLSAFYSRFTELTLVVVIIGQYWAIPHVIEDMNVLCGCLASASHCTQLFFKTFLLGRLKNCYLTYLERLHALQEESDQFEKIYFHKEVSGFEGFHKKETAYVNRIVVIQLVMILLSTLSYFLPNLYLSIIRRDQVRKMLTPIVFHIGMDINYTPMFQSIVLLLTVGFLLCNLKTVVIDNFILSIIVLQMSQLKYHNNLLKEVMDTPTVGIERRRNMVREWIKLHQALLDLCDHLRKNISPYLFIEFAYIIIHTCVPAFVITSTFSWTLPQKVAVFFIIGGGLIELFLMSNAGDVLHNAWEMPRNDLLQFEIFLTDEKWMKNAFLMIHKRLNKTFRLAAFNILPLGCATFATIIRLILSYYMTLNQLQNMKHKEDITSMEFQN